MKIINLSGLNELYSIDILSAYGPGISPLKEGIIEGENPVHGLKLFILWYVFKESGCLGMQPKLGGKSHLKLNICERPIANKYREGKMKRTLKRELNSTWNC